MKNKKQFGLIGKNIEYSFSRRFFLEKFNSNDKYLNFSYINYDINSIEEVDNVFKQKNLCGLNVTIPYKEKIIKCLEWAYIRSKWKTNGGDGEIDLEEVKKHVLENTTFLTITK